MPSGIHKTTQTAFRIPADLMASLKAAAGERNVTVTAYVVSAIEEKLAMDAPRITTGITTRITTSAGPAEPVSPPQPAARTPAPVTAAHRAGCKCGVCHPETGGKK